MFLWARYVLDNLESSMFFTRDEILRAADSQPPKLREYLHGIYDDQASLIESQYESLSSLAKLFVAWIVYPRQPLTVEELQCALASSTNLGGLEEDNSISIEALVTAYPGWVTVDKHSGLILMTHRSAYIYLRQKVADDWIPEIDSVITKICIAYLSQSSFKNGPCTSDMDFEDLSRSYPFYRYAARHWGHHAAEAAETDLEGIIEFLRQDALVGSAYQAMKIGFSDSREPGYSQKVETNITGLHLGAWFGLDRVVQAMLKAGYDTSTQKDSNGHTPLQWAAAQDQKAVVRLLLNHDNTTPFSLVAAGSLPELQRLLTAGYDPNKRGTHNRTLLHDAVLHGHADMVKTLVENGASIDETDNNDETALHLAIRTRRAKIAETLLEHSASVATITANELRDLFSKDLLDAMLLTQTPSV